MQKYKTVDEFLSDLDTDKRRQVDLLRDIIMAASPLLTEHVKWNAPSYVMDGEDRITFNLLNKEGAVKLVLHMGATHKEDKRGTPVMNDASGLIEWSSDIRGMISFQSVEDIEASLASLKRVIRAWLAIPA